MSEEITKKDWETAVLQYEAMIVNGKMTAEIHSVCLEYAKKKVSEFPKEEIKDPMPEQVKEIASVISQ
jgi:hypothetical protein